MKELGNIEFNYLFLKDINLKRCVGCFSCLQKGKNLCPLKDDRDKVFQQIMDSDGVIFASPAYNFNVTSLMKNFIDRFAYLGHRPQFLINM